MAAEQHPLQLPTHLEIETQWEELGLEYLFRGVNPHSEIALCAAQLAIDQEKRYLEQGACPIEETDRYVQHHEDSQVANAAFDAVEFMMRSMVSESDEGLIPDDTAKFAEAIARTTEKTREHVKTKCWIPVDRQPEIDNLCQFLGIVFRDSPKFVLRKPR